MKKFVCYYRVSTQQQGQSGLGLEAQESAAASYIRSVQGQSIGTFTEIGSGLKDERTQLEKALKKCRLTGATLLIAKLDRLSRSRRFLMELDESAVEFVCCDMPEANRLTIGLMACIADYEAQLISERTTAALTAAKQRGVKLGNPKLSLVRNTDTSAANKARCAKAKEYNAHIQQVISEMEADHGSPLSSRELAKRLNQADYKTSRGKPFTHVAVLRAKAS